MPRFRFDGHIAGVGTASGTRLVLGHWMRSPLGAFADVMVERGDGHRILLAPTERIADFVTRTYTFDEVVLVPVEVQRSSGGDRRESGAPRESGVRRGALWEVSAGPLQWSFREGPRTPLGVLLSLVPPPLGRTRLFASLADPVARRLMPGVRLVGSAGRDRTEWYAASDLHRLEHSRASWEGADLGPMTAVDPPAGFGFGSTPRFPSLTALTSTVQVPPGQQAL